MFPATTVLCLLLVIATASCSALQDSALDVTKRDAPDSQAECTRLLVAHLTDAACIDVANDITRLIAEEDIVSKLESLTVTFFVELCRPSCGRHILTAWNTCNITDNYKREVQLINGLCSRDHSKYCYESINELFTFIKDVEACQTGETCSRDCQNTIDDEDFGCCILLPIDFRSEGGETGLRNAVSATYSK